MKLLDERDLTAEERASVADEPRPGIVLRRSSRRGPDGYTLLPPVEIVLTQQDTNALIETELANHAGNSVAVRDDMLRLFAKPPTQVVVGEPPAAASEQRGGIHEDPVVRLLAFRAFGDRDRDWFDVHVEANEGPIVVGRDTPGPSHDGHRIVEVHRAPNPNSIMGPAFELAPGIPFGGPGGVLEIVCSCGTRFKFYKAKGENMGVKNKVWVILKGGTAERVNVFQVQVLIGEPLPSPIVCEGGPGGYALGLIFNRVNEMGLTVSAMLPSAQFGYTDGGFLLFLHE